MAVTTRPAAVVADGFGRWHEAHHEGVRVVGCTARPVTAGGHSNEVWFVTGEVTGPAGAAGADAAQPSTIDVVLRLVPEGPALFATYDLTMQARVQEAAAAHGVPVAVPLATELDPAWLGSPFQVLPRVAGRVPGELPVADEWIRALGPDGQRRLHTGFLDTLILIHGTPWPQHGAPGLRGASGDLRDEVGWWEGLAAWAFEDAPPADLMDLFAQSRATAPDSAGRTGLLWGDVRLGNVIVDDDLDVVAVLDWEMASLGPAEMDVAWHIAMDTMAEHFVGARVPGFLTGSAVVGRVEAGLGRALLDMGWYERFALARATLLNLRADALAARRVGRTPPPPGRNGVLRYAMAAFANGAG